MKILYDHQIFQVQKYGGISRYYYELIRELNKMGEVNISTSLMFSNNKYISDKILVKHFKYSSNKYFRGKMRSIMLFNRLISIKKIKTGDFDIFHPTYYDPYFLNYIGNKPFVLTVYDMIHEKLKELFSPNEQITKYKKILLEKASKIIAISKNTKRDIIELFDVDESKIEVIYLGNSMEINNESKLNIIIPKKYILFVGSRVGYKNFDRFINSVSKLLYEDNNLSIICAGGGIFNDKEILKFEKIGIINRVFQVNLNDNKLVQFYKKALLFVFPSLYEGFGIPILEAFACECPLVCSNTGSLPEIADDGAEYFDPHSEESIYRAIKKVSDNKEFKDRLVTNGIKILKHYSWKKTALKTKNVYASVIK